MAENDRLFMTLDRTVERLYTAFSTMLKPQEIVCGAYELSAGEVRQLLTHPLRGVQPGVLRSSLFDAWSTVGTWDDFRFFLPDSSNW
ncbi:hypothetical protein MF271_23725 (plasmid) [Deinococcus sp. KNUC1210]|uniref:hypothetical protein n=1 Tax=Deinococcus sp. KNUC1210 TaxID=2917691 RepID=UPI001EF039BC|nr:hypothetical protein [Deinococcus sp. KNUC1210]ULH17974.1 hypothetical protein MF271_23725 [Deinococcus sp. KNUC1210]